MSPEVAPAASTPDLLAFDNALREGRLLNPEMTAWVLGGNALRGTRNTADMGVAGGSPGTSALLESGGHWAVIVTANVDPLPEHIGVAVSQALNR